MERNTLNVITIKNGVLFNFIDAWRNQLESFEKLQKSADKLATVTGYKHEKAEKLEG